MHNELAPVDAPLSALYASAAIPYLVAQRARSLESPETTTIVLNRLPGPVSTYE